MEGKCLLFEGFLKKRKDTMRMTWTTYWFRLQNTTLFFYTKKDGSAIHLRGHYYICTVQSVREIQKDEMKRYVFEIIMKNGRKKVLAAETAALRRDWVHHLWRAMHLTSPGGSDPGSTWQELSDGISDSDSVTGSLGRDQSISALPDQDQKGRSLFPSSEETIYENTLSGYPPLPEEERGGMAAEKSTPDLLRELANRLEQTTSAAVPSTTAAAVRSPTAAAAPSPRTPVQVEGDRAHSLCVPDGRLEERWEVTGEGDYDFLPARNCSCQMSQSEEDVTKRESIYDVPLNNRRASDHQEPRPGVTESIYDVPRSFLRKMDVHRLGTSHPGDELQAEGEGLLGDMIANLRLGGLAGGSSVGQGGGCSVGQGGGCSVAWMSGATEPEDVYDLIQPSGPSA